MYKSKYKTCLRIQTPEEALMLDDEATSADLWLGVLDTYMTLSAAVQGEIPSNPEVADKIREKFMKIITLRYDELCGRIVGRLRGWTEAMLVMTVIGLAGQLGTSISLIDNRTRQYMKEERLRVTTSYDVDDWTYTDVLCALHTLESKWKNKRTAWRPECRTYLRYIEHAVDKLVTKASPLYLIDYAPHRGGRDPYNVKPEGMHELLSLVVNMRRSLVIKDVFKVKKVSVPDNDFEGFQERESRHLTTRKFRQTVTETVWDFVIRPSEKDRGRYKRKADISAFNAVGNYRSLDYLDTLSEVTTYKDQADINRDPRTFCALVISQIQAYCMGNFAINFKEYFFCREVSVLKHMKSNVIAPFIVERLGRFDCVYQGTVYETPSGTMAEAFVVWCKMCKEHFNGVLYGGLDFRMMLSVVFPPVATKVISNESDQSSGMFLSYGE